MQVLKNFSYLSLIQIVNLALPFISYGYLVKTVGLELFGIVILAQVIAAYPAIIVAYGFNIYGPKLISESVTSSDERTEIFSKIVSAKIYIAAICYTFYIAAAIAFSPNEVLKYQLILASWAFIYEALNPIWCFQGLQDLKKPTIFHGLSKILQLLLMYQLITGPEKYHLISLIYGIAALAPLVPLYVILTKEHKISFHLHNPRSITYVYKEAFDLFITNISGAVYASSAKLFVGAKFGYTEISLYDFAEKIVTLAKMPLGILTQAAYPMNCKIGSATSINKQIIAAILFGCAGYVLFLALADIVAIVIGEVKLQEAKILLTILLVTLPLSAISGFGGINFLVPFGHSSKLRQYSVVTTVMFLIGALILILQKNTTLLSFAYLTTLSELLFAILVGNHILKYRNERNNS